MINLGTVSHANMSSDLEMSAAAKRVADAVMRGDYGSIVDEDDGYDAPERSSYAGWSDVGSWDKKQVLMVSGVTLLVIAGVAGAYYLWKKKKDAAP